MAASKFVFICVNVCRSWSRVGVGHAFERFGARRFAKRLHRVDQRARGVLEKQQPGAPIGRMLPAFNQPALGEFVENAHQRDRLDLKQFGETGLMNAFIL